MLYFYIFVTYTILQKYKKIIYKFQFYKIA